MDTTKYKLFASIALALSVLFAPQYAPVVSTVTEVVGQVIGLNEEGETPATDDVVLTPPASAGKEEPSNDGGPLDGNNDYAGAPVRDPLVCDCKCSGLISSNLTNAGQSGAVCEKSCDEESKAGY